MEVEAVAFAGDIAASCKAQVIHLSGMQICAGTLHKIDSKHYLTGRSVLNSSVHRQNIHSFFTCALAVRDSDSLGDIGTSEAHNSEALVS